MRGGDTNVPPLLKSCSVELFGYFFFKKSRKIETLCQIFRDFFLLFTYELHPKNTFFWPTTTYSGLCNSTHTCSNFFFSVRFLVRVHIFILVQVWGHYLFSTPSYGFLKNSTLLVRWSGAKYTEKQDLLFIQIALTRRREELEGREWYRWKGFFLLYKLSTTSFLSLYKWNFQNTHPHLVVNKTYWYNIEFVWVNSSGRLC